MPIEEEGTGHPAESVEEVTPIERFVFIPARDITPYEVALVLSRVSVVINGRPAMDTIPPKMRRHFRKLK